jgi:AcrR family transcriptional regulator
MLEAAAELLRTGGLDGVSTRSVAAAAGVQPPTIYRQFGDKEGLLDAVVRYVLAKYLQDKRRAPLTDDPVQDLRESWDLHVDFGLTHPDCYLLAYVQPRPGRMPSLARETFDLLQELIARIADQGALRMSVNRATALMHAAALGHVVSQIRVPPEERDPQLSEIAWQNAIAGIITDEGAQRSTPSDLPGRAVALREALRGNADGALTTSEQTLMAEWLDRLADRAES